MLYRLHSTALGIKKTKQFSNSYNRKHPEENAGQYAGKFDTA